MSLGVAANARLVVVKLIWTNWRIDFHFDPSQGSATPYLYIGTLAVTDDLTVNSDRSWPFSIFSNRAARQIADYL